MARHTIGNKRGSVRGAPPQVYIPFGTFEGDGREPWADAFRLCKHFGLIALGWVIVFFFIAVLWAIGAIPHEIVKK